MRALFILVGFGDRRQNPVGKAMRAPVRTSVSPRLRCARPRFRNRKKCATPDLLQSSTQDAEKPRTRTSQLTKNVDYGVRDSRFAAISCARPRFRCIARTGMQRNRGRALLPAVNRGWRTSAYLLALSAFRSSARRVFGCASVALGAGAWRSGRFGVEGVYFVAPHCRVPAGEVAATE